MYYYVIEHLFQQLLNKTLHKMQEINNFKYCAPPKITLIAICEVIKHDSKLVMGYRPYINSNA